jgi:translation initiation factor 4B
MKSWADSDDEDEHLGPDDDDSLPVQNKVEDPPATGPEPADGERPRRHLKKDFVWPETPPYTAFVGNLAFSIKNPDELGEKILDLVKERFGADIVISNVRVAMDRHTGKQKGFGYVEVETLEQVSRIKNGLTFFLPSNISQLLLHSFF